MKVFLIIVSYIAILDVRLFSQDINPEKIRQLQQIFGEEFSKDFADFEKRYKKMLNEFFQDSSHSLTPFQDQSNWTETPNERIFSMNIKKYKNVPLNIEIKNGLVTISNKKSVEQKSDDLTQMSFNSSSFFYQFKTPSDCDSDKAQIESIKDYIKIRFPKNKLSKPRPLKLKKGEKTI